MNEASTFDQWFESEKEKGLVDIKLAIRTTNAASREVQHELVDLESKIADGLMIDKMQDQGDQPASKGARAIIGSCLFK